MADPAEVVLVMLVLALAAGLALIAIDLAASFLRWLVRGLVGTWRAFWREPDWRKPE